jgi:AraC-like DNA-binding protein/quercetin dioxygenase-like cupin family protein
MGRLKTVPDLTGDSEFPDPATELVAVLAPALASELVTERAEKQGVLAHGADIPPHRHADGQLLYPAAGVLATTTERGTWVAPANRVAWTPPGFEHHHRAYGRTDVRVVELSLALSASLPDRPTVFSVSPLLREALLALTSGRELRPQARDRLRGVIVDELVDVPEESLYLPEPADDRLRAVTDLLHADPASPRTLAEFGRAVGASERTLSRLFQAELGMSFQQWRSLLRIQHALIRLAEGHTVTDTAARSGWANPTSFIEAFTAIVGQTPGRYQTQLRRADR